MDRRNALPPLLCAEIGRVSRMVRDVEWYIFGSVLREPEKAADIDILIIYRSDESTEMVRNELREAARLFPIHLLFLSEGEEVELQFVDSQRCVRLFD